MSFYLKETTTNSYVQFVGNQYSYISNPDKKHSFKDVDKAANIVLNHSIVDKFLSKRVFSIYHAETNSLVYDKLVSDISATDEANPFMGWRSIRVCLSRKDLFKEQLRALLLASREGHLRIMFPMISSLDELREAKRLYQECRTQLLNEGVELPKVKVG